MRCTRFLFCSIVVMIGCDSAEKVAVNSQQIETGQHRIQKLTYSRLPNAIRIHDRVISGGQPDGEQAFRDLRELGIRSIISVDGVKPDVELARKYGMRYVHLPHGYSGISDERAKQLALAVRQLDGPIYIHCHHGKHRSPAAAAVACVANGMIDNAVAATVLAIAGTHKNYVGLFASVAKSRRMRDADLEAVSADFPEMATLPPLAEAMVELDHTFEMLNKFVADGGQTIADQPAIDLVHRSLLLKEHFTEMLRLDSVASESDSFRALLVASESNSIQLLQAIESQTDGGSESPVRNLVKSSLDTIAAKCTQCHRLFRDLPASNIRPAK